MSFADFLETALLDHLYTDPAYSPPATLHIGLSTTTPNESGGNFTEPVGNNYSRVSHGAAEMDAAASGDPSSKDNGSILNFPQASGSWGTLTHFGVFDAASGGNLLWFGALTTSKTIDNGDQARFNAGDFAVTQD